MVRVSVEDDVPERDKVAVGVREVVRGRVGVEVVLADWVAVVVGRLWPKDRSVCKTDVGQLPRCQTSGFGVVLAGRSPKPPPAPPLLP